MRLLGRPAGGSSRSQFPGGNEAAELFAEFAVEPDLMAETDETKTSG